MFIDKAKIYIKAGNGGDGCVSFYTEKFIANGGPDGGDGGRGGNIIFRADSRKNSLLDFRFSAHFKAEDGERGMSKFCHGRGGKDTVISVPCGTVIRDEKTDGVIADLFNDGDTVVVLTGGLGGKGNNRFKSSRRHAPHFAQSGQKTEEQSVVLELKTIADIGLVGYPNVGKSTLLSVISSARPKIADYHFTTLSPNLGIVKYHENTFAVADIPGLIEGAGTGAGLGIEFLRHIERTRLIAHVVDISGIEGRDPIADFKSINKELKVYSEKLAKLPQIIILNKCDIADKEKIAEFKKKIKKPTVQISAATREGIDELIKLLYNSIKELPPLKPMEFTPFEYIKRDTSKFYISKLEDGLFDVSGGMIDELARNVTLDNYDSFSYFQKRLKDEGVITALKRAGAADGDTIRILDIEFDYLD